MTKRHLGWGLFAIAGGMLLLAGGAVAQEIPATPEAGTFRMPEGQLPQGYGKDEATMPKEIGGQLAYPFRR